MKRRKMSEEIEQAVIEMYKDGVKPKWIARQFGLLTNDVHNIRVRYGVKPQFRNNKPKAEQKNNCANAQSLDGEKLARIEQLLLEILDELYK